MSSESERKSRGMSRLEESSVNSSCFKGGSTFTQAPDSGLSMATICWLIFLKYWIMTVARMTVREVSRDLFQINRTFKTSLCGSAKPDIFITAVIDAVILHREHATERFYFHFIKSILIVIANQRCGSNTGSAGI